MSEERISKLEDKVEAIHSRVIVVERQSAIDVVQRTHIEGQLTDLKADIGSIKGDTKKVVWLIIASLIGGGMAFIMNGGLSAAS